MNATTYAERMTKIGLVVAEILGRICRFWLSHPKSAVLTLAISRVTGTILTKRAQNVATILSLNIVKSKQPYC